MKNNNTNNQTAKTNEPNKFPQGYFDIFSQAFKRIWKNPRIWFWGLLVPSGFTAQFGGGGSPTDEGQSDFSWAQMQSFLMENIAWIAVGVLLFLLVFLAIWLISTIARGGLIKKIDKMQNIKNEKSGFKEVWTLGRICFWPILKVDLLVAAFNFLIILAASAALFGIYLIFPWNMNSGDMPSVSAVLLAVLAVLAIFVLMLLLILSKRIAVIFVTTSNVKVLEAFKKAVRIILTNKWELIKLLFLFLFINILAGIAMIAASFGSLLIVAAPIALFAKLAGFSNAVIIMISGMAFVVIMLAIALFLKAFLSLWKLDMWIWWVKKICARKNTEEEKTLQESFAPVANPEPRMVVERSN
ncbi:MAG: hypothetical protein U5L10_01245 [Candidatus Moranbacteria bacterium]|nr:hypothetical protein [Candidatus Moranbacteria bacterium]